VTSQTAGAKYPMYVLPVAEFLTMSHWSPHQDLLASGVLREFDDTMWGKVFFVSHQWVAYDHPDPEAAQLGALQSVVRKLAAGLLIPKGNFAVEFGFGLKQGHTSAEWIDIMKDAYLWIDYTSMPQPLASLPRAVDGGADAPHAGMVSDHRHSASDVTVHANVSLLIEQLKAAVDAIPSYIERCAEMMVLVPSVKHADRKDVCCDFTTWRSRGWCRMEFVSSRLACDHDIPVMVINSKETTPTYFNLCDTMRLFAGNGTFTVDNDKYKVRGVLESMITSKANAEFDKGNIGLFRAYTILRPMFLMGLPEGEAPEGDDEQSASQQLPTLPSEAVPTDTDPNPALTALKKLVRWRDDEAEAEWVTKTGMTLMHLAAGVHDLDAVNELLASPEHTKSLNVPMKVITAIDTARGSKAMGVATITGQLKGLTPLALAMSTNSPKAVEVTKALLSAGASDSGMGFINACVMGSIDSMKAYLDHKGSSFDINKPKLAMMGCTPLHATCFFGDANSMRTKVEFLLAHGARPSLKKRDLFGGSPLCCLGRNADANPDVVKILIDAGCDVSTKEKPHVLVKAGVGMLKLLQHVKPAKFETSKELTDLIGGTAMHHAAWHGNVALLKAIGEHTPKMRKNNAGRTPLETLTARLPDSHAPQLLDKILVAPEEKMRHAKLKKAAFGATAAFKLGKRHAQVLPNSGDAQGILTALTSGQ